MNDLRGLRSFAEVYGTEHRPVVVYQGAVEKQVDGVLVTTLVKLLQAIQEGPVGYHRQLGI